MTPAVQIVNYNPAWPEEFLALAGRLRLMLGPLALRIDHIGSTSVPGLAAKDIIDVQVTVESGAGLDAVAATASKTGCVVNVYQQDHVVPGMDADPALWAKRLFHPPEGERPANIHVRALGHPNQRYALLFRDYLRAHPATVAAYAEAKRRLADAVPDRAMYAETKDPTVDLIYLPAEEWASRTAWEPADDAL
ncbi:MAG TPA: GrpB family protein [Tepidiformaceae bacterium]|nr:GrpB family protein [Tepidiformaceae bacterium]